MADDAPAAATHDDAPGTTFYLDELREGAGRSRWGLHDPARSQLPRFLLWGCALILLLGLLVGLGFDGLEFLKENYWALLLWAAITGLVYRFKFRRRPRLHIGADGLALRVKSHRAERRVPWGALEGIDLEPTAVVLRRAASGPLHLYFPNLSGESVEALKDALAAAARRHGVPVA